MATKPSASIIIPAHNEARVIVRTLRSLTAASDPNEFDVIVVCNGCTDLTATRAASLNAPGVRVLSIEEPSKSRAMSVGDATARAYPRLYLDADVELSTEGARSMVNALAAAASVVASPQYQLEGCTRPARAYWQEWQRRNSQPRSGTGCFGLSKQARASFEDFPQLLGDDQWVAANFAPEIVPAAETHVRVAQTIPAIFRRRVRIARGNRQVLRLSQPPARKADTEGTPSGRARVTGMAVLIGVHGVASLWARVVRSGGWAQDETSRGDGDAAPDLG